MTTEHDSTQWTGHTHNPWPGAWRAWRATRGLILWLFMLDCAWCAGTAREFWGSSWQPCSACDGRGSYWAQRRREQLDAEALAAPPRCGCPECSGEWDR